MLNVLFLQGDSGKEIRVFSEALAFELSKEQYFLLLNVVFDNFTARDNCNYFPSPKVEAD
jgi:hypothetical protein